MASCIACTAAISAAMAGRISAVVPSVSSTYTPRGTVPEVAFTLISSQLCGSEQRTVGVHRFVRRVVEPVAHGDDPFDVPDRFDDLVTDQRGLRVARHRDHAILYRHPEAERVHQVGVQDDVAGDLFEDLVVRA